MDRTSSAAFACAALIGIVALLAPAFFNVASAPLECSSKKMTARLTGWSLNGKIPHGNADFDAAAGRLEISVSNVSLADGTILDVFDGDDKIGSLPALKGGEASATITSDRPQENSRIRVLNDDRPIVSANLHCFTPSESAPPVRHTPTPSPSPTPQP